MKRCELDKRKLKKVEFKVSLLNLILCYPDQKTQLWIMMRFGSSLAESYKNRKNKSGISQKVATDMLEMAKEQAKKEIKASPIELPIKEMGLDMIQESKIVYQLELFEQRRKLDEV
jgi:hypothetical protein